MRKHPDSSLNELLSLMATLRDPEKGCPWDKAQTFETIVPHTIEEAYEVAEAIEQGEVNAIRSELGDLLFQVVFYAQMAKEKGWFDFADIADGITEKMQRRHPHVFGDMVISSEAEQARVWDSIKQAENPQTASVLDGVGKGLPAIIRARKLQSKAARSGFDWPDHKGVIDKIDEEIAELKQAIEIGKQNDIESEMGDVLFVCVNLCRHLSIDPEIALGKTSGKFVRRFKHMEELAAAQNCSIETLALEEQEAMWQQAKRDLAE